jgi:hypothetical protein
MNDGVGTLTIDVCNASPKTFGARCGVSIV